MQRNAWMRPALQQSEAVMLPALQRRRVGEAQFSDLYYHPQPAEDPFRPVVSEETQMTTTALSTYVRPRGSIAGRSVLRAAGVAWSPLMGNARPAYYQAGMNRRSSLLPRGFFR